MTTKRIERRLSELDEEALRIEHARVELKRKRARADERLRLTGELESKLDGIDPQLGADLRALVAAHGEPAVEKAERGLSPIWIAGLFAVIGAGAWFYAWLVASNPVRGAADWGSFGDAVGPFVALLNAGALFAALYSVRLQRQELALQRQELAANREVMKEQAEQFERTARSQQQLANAQLVSNRIALESNVTLVVSTSSRIAAQAAELNARDPELARRFSEQTQVTRDLLAALMNRQMAAARELEVEMGHDVAGKADLTDDEVREWLRKEAIPKF